MKYLTHKNKGQDTYPLTAEILGVVSVKVNGKEVPVEFYMNLPNSAEESGELNIEIIRATVTGKPSLEVGVAK